MARSTLQRIYDALPGTAQDLVLRVAGVRSYRLRFGADFRRALGELGALDGASADAIASDQERRLRQTVSHAAATVPYYRELFRREGIDPDSIRHIEDLAQIPPLEKETVRMRLADLVSETMPSRERIAGHTSGTSGTPLTIIQTRRALGYEYAAAWRQRGWHGCGLGDRFAAFGGQKIVPVDQEDPPFWRFEPARNRMIFSLYHMKPENFQVYASELAKPGYRFWQGYPSSIAWIASQILSEEIQLGRAAPPAVFTSSETLLANQRAAIVSATGAVVADRYANSELCISITQHPDGVYRVDTEVGAVEIDPQERGDGWVRGEILATGFSNLGMPFLRYRTGDVATLRTDPPESVSQGRPVIEAIDGRVEDYVVTPDGRRVGRMDHAFKNARALRELQILQKTPESILLRVVPAEGFDARARGEIESSLRSRLGHQIRIDFEIVDAIAREPNGKFRAVISQVGQIDSGD